MRATFCENCGSRVFSGRCVNCDEVLFVLEQYVEQGMKLPGEDSEFMKEVEERRGLSKKVDKREDE